jgi:tRNA-dependent cyclodipeptide synthase
VSDAVLTPQASKVKVRFVCPQDYKNRFAESHCLVLIPFDHQKLAIDELRATLTEINKNFQSCTLLLPDLLERHIKAIFNPMESHENLKKAVFQETDLWLQKNLNSINSLLEIPYKIIKWEDYLNNSNYASAYESIDKLYAKNMHFQMAVFITAKSYIWWLGKINKFNCIDIYKRIINLIKEECAVHLLIAQEQFEFIASYKRNYAMETANNYLLKPSLCNFKQVEIKLINELIASEPSKLKTKVCFKTFGTDRKELNKSSCLLTISVGQKSHESEKFLATIQSINKSVKTCTIVVGDTLQRHTIGLGQTTSMDQRYQEAKKAGDLWLQRNKSLYSQLTIPYQIIRWDDCLEHPSYKKHYEQISSLYMTDENYRKAFLDTISEFMQRYNRQDSLKNTEIAHYQCLEYLKEECAALCSWAEGKYNFEIYPGRRNKAMAATHKKFIEPKFPACLKEIAIKFKN